MSRWFWRFLAMAILAVIVGVVARWLGSGAVEVLAIFGVLVALALAGVSGLVAVVLFIFRKAMQP